MAQAEHDVRAEQASPPLKRRRAWKVALFAAVFCYPIGALTGTWIGYARLSARSAFTVGEKFDMIRSGNRIAIIVGAAVWLIAVVASVVAMRVDDLIERQVGRFTFVLVITVAIFYIAAGGFTQLFRSLGVS